jgi:anti-sigma-K factor RskA
VNPDVHTLTGAYALNALDDTERETFERHLAACPDCTQEVAELRLTANRLGAAASETPPDRLRQRVLAEISRVRQDSPTGLRVVGSDDSKRRPGPRRWVVGLTSVAAAVALAAAGTFGVVAIHARQQLNSTQSELAQASSLYQPLAQVLGAPDVRSTSANGSAGGNATAVVSKKLNEAVVMAFNMPNPPAGHAFQAWAIGSGHDPQSLGLITAGTGNTSQPVVVKGLAGTQKIGVTVEPAGGSKKPSSDLVMLFDLPL